MTSRASTVLADSPLLFLRYSDATTTAADDSGAGRNGTYQGTYALNQGGLFTGDPDGSVGLTDGGVVVPYGAWMDVTEITCEAGVQLDSHPEASSILAIRDSGGSSTRAFAWAVLADGHQRVTLFNPANVGVDADSASTIDDCAHLLGFSFSNATSQVRFYRDGAPDGVVTVPYGYGLRTSGPDVLTSGFYFGSSALNRIGRVHGRLDDLAVFGSVLSDARMAAHYAVAPPAPCDGGGGGWTVGFLA
jgi:hypothetical protein